MKRFIFISDTHSLHKNMIFNVTNYIDPTKENYLIHGGDCTNMGYDNEIVDFINWFKNLSGFNAKIFIAGNHDFGFQNYLRDKQRPNWENHILNEYNLSLNNVYYLHDSEIIIDGIKFYGSPWQPEFYNWAFNLPRNGNELKERWEKIPLDTDILITHGPPMKILDLTPRNLHVGCELLVDVIKNVKPTFHIFGHIHNGYGILESDSTLHINASICTEQYKPHNQPIVVDYDEETKNYDIFLL